MSRRSYNILRKMLSILFEKTNTVRFLLKVKIFCKIYHITRRESVEFIYTSNHKWLPWIFTSIMLRIYGAKYTL